MSAGFDSLEVFAWRCSAKKLFAAFNGKQLYQSLFFNEVAGCKLTSPFTREASSNVFMCVLPNFSGYFFYRALVEDCL